MEEEIKGFSRYFLENDRRAHGDSDAFECVLSLHEETLKQLSDYAIAKEITGSNEYVRSVALQLSLDEYLEHAREAGVQIDCELHLSSGMIKDRPLCLFKDTLDSLVNLTREHHCSETVLLETAVSFASGNLKLMALAG